VSGNLTCAELRTLSFQTKPITAHEAGWQTLFNATPDMSITINTRLGP